MNDENVKTWADTREFVRWCVGKTADEIEAGVLLFMVEIADREWADIPRRQKADRLGKFWLPCLLCGDWFGGNEWQANKNECSSFMLDAYSGHGICANCSDRAKALNDKWPNGIRAVIEHGQETSK